MYSSQPGLSVAQKMFSQSRIKLDGHFYLEIKKDPDNEFVCDDLLFVTGVHI